MSSKHTALLLVLLLLMLLSMFVFLPCSVGQNARDTSFGPVGDLPLHRTHPVQPWFPLSVPIPPLKGTRENTHVPLHDGLRAPAPLGINSIFLEASTYNSGGNGTDSLAIADVNGDGKLDLVVANSCASATNCANGSVSVLLGNGNGNFGAPVSYNSGGYEADFVAVADVNGDGKIDLLVANVCNSSSDCTDGVIGVLLGNGDGTFQPPVDIALADVSARSIAIGDVNGDGKPDLIVANADNAVDVLLGNGDGTFKAAVSYNSGGDGPDSVAVADVNGDGKLDIVVSNQCNSCTDGSIGVLLGNGDGTFQTVVTYDSGGQSSRSVAVADVNGDGKPDVLVANYCLAADDFGGSCVAESVVGVLLGNGDGTFQTAVIYGSGGFNALSIAAGDVNGDGKTDLIVGNGCASDPCLGIGTAAVLFGNGDGTFQLALAYDSGGSSAESVAVGDVNGDGYPDLLVANSCSVGEACTDGVVGLMLGHGNGAFKGALAYSSSAYDPDSIAVADVNGDGKPDLLVENYCFEFIVGDECVSEGSVAVLLGNGDGTFQTSINYDTGGEYGYAVAVADVNGDGKADLLVANLCGEKFCLGERDGVVGVLLGNGDGTFQTVVTYDSGGQSATSIAVADVNGDGKPDLLVTNYDDDNVAVLLGNGDGTFQAAVTYGSGGHDAASVAVGDVNEDGKADILVANECVSLSSCANGVLGVLLGNGDGTFQAAVTYNSGGDDATSVAVGDMNGDGRADLVVANNCSFSSCTNGVLSVLLGNGDGTFQPAIVTAAPGPIGSGALNQLAIADFNGDGKLDVASGSGDFLFFGNGNGTFQSPLSLNSGVGTGVAAADFNQDGRPDLAVGGVNILLNISPLLSTATTLSSSMNPSLEGKPISFNAAVSSTAGTPAGSVKFLNGTAILATVQLKSGKAQFTTSQLPAGVNSITAVYGGNSKYAGSTSAAVRQVVLAPTTTTLASSPDPSRYGQTVKFTATVTSPNGAPPNGEIVTFEQGSTVLGTAHLSGGKASFSTSTLTVGDHKIRAIYGGGFAFAPSASEVLSQLVEKAESTTTLPRQ